MSVLFGLSASTVGGCRLATSDSLSHDEGCRRANGLDHAWRRTAEPAFVGVMVQHRGHSAGEACLSQRQPVVVH